MIILPSEEKKPSLVLKWIFRTLMIVVIMGALLIFALNILSGTGDAHRRGLEQALSDIFKTNVTIGTLKQFNIFPLFTIEMEDIRAPYGPAGGEVRAERVVLVFRFFDLLLGRDLIKDLQISNLTMTPDIVGAYGLRIESAGIVPEKTKEERTAFKLQGQYGGLPVHVSLGLETIGGVQPVYRIINNLPADLTFGKLAASGKFVQNGKGEPSIQNAQFSVDSENIATGAITLLTSKETSGLQVDFMTTLSQGSLTASVEPKAQAWNFEKLDLSDVISDDPVWAQISNALNEIDPPATTAQDRAPATQIDVMIKSMTGGLIGENLRGSFTLYPDRLTGWWDGVITIAAPKAENLPASGAVQCGLISLSPKESAWQTDNALVFIDPASILTKVMINSSTGKIDWSINRVASGTPTAFNADLKPYVELKEKLKFPDAHPCLAHIGKVSAL